MLGWGFIFWQSILSRSKWQWLFSLTHISITLSDEYSMILKFSSYPIFQNSYPNLLDFVNHFCSFNTILVVPKKLVIGFFPVCQISIFTRYELSVTSHHVWLKIKTPYCRSPFYVNFLMLLKFLNKPIETLQYQGNQNQTIETAFWLLHVLTDHHGFLLEFYFCYITNCQTAITAVCEK